MLGGLGLHGVELAAQAARGGALLLELARDPVVHATGGLVGLAGVVVAVGRPRGELLAQTGGLGALGVDGPLGLLARGLQLRAQPLGLLRLGLDRAVGLLARGRELLADLRRGGALGGEPLLGVEPARLELGLRAVALGLGDGQRRPHRLGVGAQLLDLGAQRLELAVAVADRGLRLVAQADDLGLALGERRLELLAALALLGERRAVGRGLAAARRRQVDHQAAADLQLGARDRLRLAVVGEQRPPLAAAAEVAARVGGQLLVLAVDLERQHRAAEPAPFEAAPAATDLELVGRRPGEPLELERDLTHFGHRPRPRESRRRSPSCPAGGRRPGRARALCGPRPTARSARGRTSAPRR